jgi:hypothetical protein
MAEEAKELRDFEAEYDIDFWYELYADVTFQTEFLPVLPMEACAIVTQYEKLHKIDRQETRDILGKWGSNESSLSGSISSLTSNISASMLNSPDKFSGFFVRLSSRSPKDSAFETSRMSKIVKDLLAEEKVGTDLLDDEWRQNYHIATFFRAQSQALKVSSAQEAMDLFVKSERVYRDLLTDLELCDESTWKMKVAVRGWRSDSDISGEFRCFVYNRKITAISQYYDLICFPKLGEVREQLKKSIIKFFKEKIEPKLPFDNCIMDVSVIGDPKFQPLKMSSAESLFRNDDFEVREVLLIEFNPWNRFTSGCRFQWKHPLDIKILEGEKKKQFRYVKKPWAFQRVSSLADAGGLLMTHLDPELEAEFKDTLGMLQKMDIYEEILATVQNVGRSVKLEDALRVEKALNKRVEDEDE